MTRRTFVSGSALGILAAPLVAGAQRRGNGAHGWCPHCTLGTWRRVQDCVEGAK